MTNTSAQWVLRIAVAAEFFGHGCFAVMQNPAWIPFVTFFGWSDDQARVILFIVGCLDITLAISVLVKPWPPALAWMSFWATFAAALRPLTGGSILEFIERGANIGAPLALLFLVQTATLKKRPKA